MGGRTRREGAGTDVAYYSLDFSRSEQPTRVWLDRDGLAGQIDAPRGLKASASLHSAGLPRRVSGPPEHKSPRSSQDLPARRLPQARASWPGSPPAARATRVCSPPSKGFKGVGTELKAADGEEDVERLLGDAGITARGRRSVDEESATLRPHLADAGGPAYLDFSAWQRIMIEAPVSAGAETATRS
ncbi:hypothetical protein ABVK25_012431 [Lepraria finkii]|uniref:Uncharacterized protein n=1 Tax=Lepraria finkii TaxID=1340010 RepID=A0ABR4AE80_9LECA